MREKKMAVLYINYNSDTTGSCFQKFARRTLASRRDTEHQQSNDNNSRNSYNHYYYHHTTTTTMINDSLAFIL